ncbi:MAG: TetR/AcrR family transcriptional regulator [Alphaproteobacteria bacterium]|nr:MAG: TetR/AcrR family transcriptional regulator [Alphaproteobacteria bacterium]
MGYTPEHTQRTRQRILASARRLFKERGYEGVNIDTIMGNAGLTRGGFYAHFKSKDELFAQAISETPVLDLLNRHPHDSGEPDDWTRRVLEEYVGSLHRDNVGGGCPIAVHASSVTRAAPQVRHAFTNAIKSLVDELTGRLAGTSDNPSNEALAKLALVAGGVALARAVDDQDLSNNILDACKDAIGPI